MQGLITGRHFLSFYHWFKVYVRSFYNHKSKERQKIISLKEKHTLRVCQEIVNLGRKLNLKQEELFLAKTIGLFHDVGRFPQYEKYGTFRDAASENHALLGVKVLKKSHILENLPANVQNIILKAIEYHNVRKLPDNLSDEVLFYSRLIRDADKLDVLRVFINSYEHPTPANKTIELELPDKEGYSTEIINDILNNQISDLKLMQCKNDMKLMLLSWIFDINFKPTFQVIKRRQYLEKILSFLPHTEDIRRIEKHLKNYLQNSC